MCIKFLALNLFCLRCWGLLNFYLQKGDGKSKEAGPSVTHKTPDQLEALLADQSYIVGYEPSAADAEAYKRLSPTDLTSRPNLNRWHRHIATFLPNLPVSFLCMTGILCCLALMLPLKTPMDMELIWLSSVIIIVSACPTFWIKNVSEQSGWHRDHVVCKLWPSHSGRPGKLEKFSCSSNQRSKFWTSLPWTHQNSYGLQHEWEHKFLVWTIVWSPCLLVGSHLNWQGNGWEWKETSWIRSWKKQSPQWTRKYQASFCSHQRQRGVCSFK